ncbi:MAG: hypothetical protein PHI18_08220, partial [bacterium]|nr:hypothetical protein [bacterium]
MKSRVLLMLVAALLMFVLGCDDENVQVEDFPWGRLEVLERPTAIAANVDQWYVFRVRVAESGAPPSIACFVYRPGVDPNDFEIFRLYDDGGQTFITEPPYADTTSGDVVAANGTYTARINGQTFAQGITGIYAFDWELTFGGASFEIPVENAEPCLISEYTEVAHFAECFAPTTLEVTISTSDMDRTDTVEVWLMDSDNQTVMNVGQFSPT